MKKDKKHKNKENANLTEWQTIMQMWDSESNRFWTRSNIFTLINGIFLSLLVAKFNSYIIVLLGAIFGLLFSYYWLWVNKLGTWYVKRWNQIIIHLENKYQNAKIDSFHKLIKNDKIERKFTEYEVDAFHKLRSIEKPYREKSSTNYMGKVIKLFIAGYLILFFVSSVLILINSQTYTLLCKKNLDTNYVVVQTQISSFNELKIPESRKESIKVHLIIPTTMLNDSTFNDTEIVELFTKDGFKLNNISFEYNKTDKDVIEASFYYRNIIKDIW